MNRRSLLRGFLLLPVAARLAPVVKAAAPATVIRSSDWAVIYRSYSYSLDLSPAWVATVNWIPFTLESFLGKDWKL